MTEAWGLVLDTGRLVDQAWRTRQAAMEWATRRFIGATDYEELRSVGPRWRLAKRRHKGMRIVRVSISKVVSY